jgi:hypothetical protein
MRASAVPKSRGPVLRTLLAALATVVLVASAAAHPANIPVARAKVQVDGTIELTISFDILAFVLDQTPTLVLDAPMNSLLDGPARDLENRLADAKKRFVAGLSVSGGDKNGVIDAVVFPSAAETHRVADTGQTPRLPVMTTATVMCHLAPGARKVSLRFAEVLGTVVLSTEFPYIEPVAESVEPGDWSTSLQIPTQAEVNALAGAARPRNAGADQHSGPPKEAQARAAIQAQYDAWSRAYMAHDLDTLEAILAPDYTLKTAKGALIKAPEYAVMLKLRKQKHSDTTHYSTEILRVTLRDGVAAIWSRETTTDPGLNGKTGKIEPISYLHDYVDLWIYSGGKWLLKSTVTQKETVIPTVR